MNKTDFKNKTKAVLNSLWFNKAKEIITTIIIQETIFFRIDRRLRRYTTYKLMI